MVIMDVFKVESSMYGHHVYMQEWTLFMRKTRMLNTGKTCCLCVHQRLSALIGYVVLLRSVTEYIGERSNRGVCYNRVACNHGILGP